MLKRRLQIGSFFIALLGLVGWGPFSFMFNSNQEPLGSENWINKEIRIIQSQAGNIDPTVLRLSLLAYQKAKRERLTERDVLTIIDYRKSSLERRFWVVDLRTNRVLFNTYVSHGKNSGIDNAISFSNQPGSLKSSLGVFLTERPYVGNHGYSLRLIGLERGVNDNAYRRAIVVHGAWYVGPEIIRKYRKIGRSWGCPAVSDKLARPIINAIKDHSLVFVYSNDHRWLRSSSFLAG